MPNMNLTGQEDRSRAFKVDAYLFGSELILEYRKKFELIKKKYSKPLDYRDNVRHYVCHKTI